VKLSPRWVAAAGASVALAITAAPAATAAPASTTPQAASSVALAQSDAAADRVGIDQSPVREAVDRAINPGDYQCAPTEFNAYINGLIAGLSDDDFSFLVQHLEMLDIPTYDALLFGTSTDSRY
jgi:hypothetical protein